MLGLTRKNEELITYVALAELSLIIVSLMVLRGTPGTANNGLFRLVFALICILGIVAGLFPRFLSFSKAERRDGEGVAGHHPDCGFFNGHSLKIMGSIRCAGCMGLVVGAIISLFGLSSGSYPASFGIEAVFWGGVLFVALGLAQHFIDMGNGWVHLLLNTFFVIGAWLLFDSVQFLGLGAGVQVYFLASTVFWIWARIRASQWTHVYVCRGCPIKCGLLFE
jgi:hypothetical protein